MSTQTFDVGTALTDVEQTRQSILSSVQPLIEQLTNDRKKIDAKLASLKIIDRDMKSLTKKIQSVSAKPTLNGLKTVIQKTREAQQLLDNTDPLEHDEFSDDDEQKDDEDFGDDDEDAFINQCFAGPSWKISSLIKPSSTLDLIDRQIIADPYLRNELGSIPKQVLMDRKCLKKFVDAELADYSDNIIQRLFEHAANHFKIRSPFFQIPSSTKNQSRKRKRSHF